MRNIIALAVVSLTVLFRSYGQQPTTGANPRIEVSITSLKVNGHQLSRPVAFEGLKSVLGTPSRIKTNSSAELATKQQKFGIEPNSIYIYDRAGIALYRKPSRGTAESMEISFERENLAHSPTGLFTGAFVIGGKKISRYTTVADLREITGMELNNSLGKVYAARYGVNTLVFDFGQLTGGAGLASVSIELGATPRTNAKGWSAQDITMMEAVFAGNPQFQTLAAQANVSATTLAHCLTPKVATQLSQAQVQHPTEQVQNRLQAFISECITQMAGR